MSYQGYGQPYGRPSTPPSSVIADHLTLTVAQSRLLPRVTANTPRRRDSTLPRAKASIRLRANTLRASIRLRDNIHPSSKEATISNPLPRLQASTLRTASRRHSNTARPRLSTMATTHRHRRQASTARLRRNTVVRTERRLLSNTAPRSRPRPLLLGMARLRSYSGTAPRMPRPSAAP